MSHRIYRLGEKAVVLDCAMLYPTQTRLAIQQKLWSLQNQFIIDDPQKLLFDDIVLGMSNLTLFLKQAKNVSSWLIKLDKLWRKQQDSEHGYRGKTVEIPVVYGGQYGPDLEFVAQNAKMTEQQVITCHTQNSYPVLFLGFQPGFPYLSGLDKRLFTARRSEPRVSIAAGSVGIGGDQTGIYPQKSPGGWQIIGRTNSKLYDSEHSLSLLSPGDSVKFKAVDSLELSI